MVGTDKEPSTLKDLGLNKNQSSTFQKIASIPEDDFENFISEKKEAVKVLPLGMQYYLNIIGLVCDIIGAFILFRYGLPAQVNKGGAINLILEQTDKIEEEKWKRFDLISKIGILLIIVGFIFQLTSTIISMQQPAGRV